VLSIGGRPERHTRRRVIAEKMVVLTTLDSKKRTEGKKGVGYEDLIRLDLEFVR